MIYILWDLFFISCGAPQICVCGDHLQASGGFSSFAIADFSLIFLFLRLCSLHKANTQTSYCGFQNRTETAIDSVQLTTALVITPPSCSSQWISLLLISLRMKNQGRPSLSSQHPNHEPTSVPESSAPILLQ